VAPLGLRRVTAHISDDQGLQVWRIKLSKEAKPQSKEREGKQPEKGGGVKRVR